MIKAGEIGTITMVITSLIELDEDINLIVLVVVVKGEMF